MTSTSAQPGGATASQRHATAADHETQVQALARYAARATFGDLSAQSRAQLPIHILDSLACCIAAPGAARSTRAATRSGTSAAVTAPR
jgi:hypothetical protein